MTSWGSQFRRFPFSTRAFYHRIFWLAELNLEAYKRGLVSHRLCDTEKTTEIEEMNWQIFVAKAASIKAALDCYGH